MSLRLAISLLLSLGVACGPPDFSVLDIVIDLDPPDFAEEAVEIPLCDAADVYQGDVGPLSPPGPHLEGKCGIEGNVVIDPAVERLGAALTSIREVRGDVTIEPNAAGGVMISLERITGHLLVNGATLRTPASPTHTMEKLESVGSVTFGLRSSSALNGLTGLKTVKGNFLVQSSGGFMAVRGLENLTQVGGTLSFENVGQVGAIDLPNLKSAGRVVVKKSSALKAIAFARMATVTNLSIMDNPQLLNVLLPALVSIEGASAIVNNPAGDKFMAPNLENAGDLTHCDNGAGLERDLAAAAGRITTGSIGPCRR